MMKKTVKLISASVALAFCGAAFGHSESFEPEFVQTLVDPYLTIQKALAGDDFAAAKSGAEAYLTALEKAPKDEEAASETAKLSSPAKAVASAPDISTARKAFLGLSEEMKMLIKHVGISGSESLYVARCPMAFGGKGGIWISDKKAILNPYYGSSMLTCGMVQEQIAGEEKKTSQDSNHDGGHDNHKGHNH